MADPASEKGDRLDVLLRKLPFWSSVMLCVCQEDIRQKHSNASAQVFSSQMLAKPNDLKYLFLASRSFTTTLQEKLV